MENKMFDEYDQVINSKKTYKTIAETLEDTGKCLIGWTDQRYDHRDILFTYQPKTYGVLQRGFRWCYFYVSIMDSQCYGFLIEINTDNRKHNSYIKEKLRLHKNECDDSICDLINGIIHEIDILEGWVSPEEDEDGIMD